MRTTVFTLSLTAFGLLAACETPQQTTTSMVEANAPAMVAKQCIAATAEKIGTYPSDMYQVNQTSDGSGMITTVTKGPMQTEYDCRTDASGAITSITARS